MDSSTNPATARELAFAEEVLLKAPLAFVAMMEPAAAPAGPPHPYVVPMNFAYVPASTGSEGSVEPRAIPGRIFVHTGVGRKTQALARNPLVSIAVTAEEHFRKGASPCQDGFAFRSVLIKGRAGLIEQAGERESALREIVAKYDPAAAADAFHEDALAQTLVYAIEIETISYKERPRRS